MLTIEKTLISLSYQNSPPPNPMQQMMSDFLRKKEHLYINNQAFGRILEEQGLDDEAVEEMQNSADDPQQQVLFKNILGPIFLGKDYSTLSEQQQISFFEKLGRTLHQGALLASLEAQVHSKLTENNLFAKDAKTLMERRVDIHTRPGGCDLKESFDYYGKIVPRSAELEIESWEERQKKICAFISGGM